MRLPHELLKDILQPLPRLELDVCQLVCKRLHRFVDSYSPVLPLRQLTSARLDRWAGWYYADPPNAQRQFGTMRKARDAAIRHFIRDPAHPVAPLRNCRVDQLTLIDRVVDKPLLQGLMQVIDKSKIVYVNRLCLLGVRLKRLDAKKFTDLVVSRMAVKDLVWYNNRGSQWSLNRSQNLSLLFVEPELQRLHNVSIILERSSAKQGLKWDAVVQFIFGASACTRLYVAHYAEAQPLVDKVVEGKSSLLSRLVDKSQADVSGQAGVALEYAYATRTRNNIRDFAHIWELCGGGSLASLVEVPTAEKNIGNISLVLFLDLTKPEEYQRVIEPLLTTVRRRLDHVLKGLQDRQPLLRDKIIATARQKFDGHVDKRVIEPICIPFTIIGAKYDDFQHFETDRKRTITRFLRFLAHVNGASFVMYSSNNENLVNRGRSLLSHLAFNTSLNRTVSTDIQGPISIPAGADTIESIGSFGATMSMIASYKEAMEQWHYALNERFPQKPSETSHSEDPSVDSQFAEPLIDNLVEQKRRELELYIKEKRDRNAAEERTNQRAF